EVVGTADAFPVLADVVLRAAGVAASHLIRTARAGAVLRAELPAGAAEAVAARPGTALGVGRASLAGLVAGNAVTVGDELTLGALAADLDRAIPQVDHRTADILRWAAGAAARLRGRTTPAGVGTDVVDAVATGVIAAGVLAGKLSAELLRLGPAT